MDDEVGKMDNRMTSLARKFGLVVAAALALALVPGSSFSAWGQSKPSPQGSKAATGSTGSAGKSGATGSTSPSAAEVIKKAGKMTTEAGRREVAAAEQREAEAKAKADAAKSGKPGESKNAVPKTSGFIIEKGDPFAIPLKATPSPAANPQDLPPGQAGLLVSQADLQGVMKMPAGNVALVRGPHNRTYFLKVNDKIYQARVTKITADSISFEETTVDPMGKTSKREITKALPVDAKKP
jgi:hypothetical protein